MMSANIRFPNFLCIGSPKCGSSWLHELLDSHPHIYIPSELKELHFFDEKFDRGFGWYSKFFENMGTEQKLSGELTPHYLYSDPARIKQCESIRKFLIIYRDPVERCISHYKFRMQLDNFDGSFDEFLAEYPEAIEWSCYGKHFKRFLDCFDRQQFLVMSFEKATKEVAKTKLDLAEFLGVNAALFPESAGSSKINPSFKPRNRSLYVAAIRIAKWMGDWGLYRLRNLIKQSSLTQRFLTTGNGNFEIEISDAKRKELRELFADDQELFHALIQG